MSAQFVIGYAGLYYREVAPHLVPANRATQYLSTADAYLAAHQAGLSPNNVNIEPLADALTKESI